ncbi:phosphodiesterase [Fischerella thermalis CCMEE 5319]|nr:phosphodiesterase [Fischerella thermalis CCMEE 5319]
MKKIFLLSDTHSYIDTAISRYASTADEVWHAGDIGSVEVTDTLAALSPQLRAVYGNIDDTSLRLRFPLDQVFEIEGLKVWITHIGGYPGRYSKRVKDLWPEIRPNLFICGHSHILKVIKDTKKQCLHLNPGAVGHHGFHQMRTALLFELSEGTVRNLEIIEFGKRGML